jgi:hypothetical protein
MRKWFPRLLVFSTLALALVIGPAAPVAANEGSSLSAVRKATAAFHNVARAERAGYGQFLPCFDSPGVGGMGQHYVNGALIDGTVTPTKPQAMVYEVDGDELTLVAVEYIILYSQTPRDAAAPRLFGQPFLHNDGLRLWALHAWIWKHNPLGTFAPYNPKVEMCPGSPAID